MLWALHAASGASAAAASAAGPAAAPAAAASIDSRRSAAQGFRLHEQQSARSSAGTQSRAGKQSARDGQPNEHLQASPSAAAGLQGQQEPGLLPRLASGCARQIVWISSCHLKIQRAYEKSILPDVLHRRRASRRAVCISRSMRMPQWLSCLSTMSLMSRRLPFVLMRSAICDLLHLHPTRVPSGRCACKTQTYPAGRRLCTRSGCPSKPLNRRIWLKQRPAPRSSRLF
jgi:hypothetical protein